MKRGRSPNNHHRRVRSPATITKPTTNMELPRNTIEITKAAAWALIGNDDEAWRDFYNCEQFEMSTYEGFGVRIFVICNFTSPEITQYYIQDINA